MNAMRLSNANTLGLESTSACPSLINALSWAFKPSTKPFPPPVVAKSNAAPVAGCCRLPIVSLLRFELILLSAPSAFVHFTPSSSRAVSETSSIIASMMICLAGLSMSLLILSKI